MPFGQFKKGLWTIVRDEFNRRVRQLRQKYQRLKQRHRMFAQLIGQTGMGWDIVTKTVKGSDVAWA